MTVVKIDVATEGQIVYFPGVGREGTVLQLIIHHGHNQSAVILLSDGREITYTRKTWYAVDKEHIPVDKRGQGIPVGADRIRKPIHVARSTQERNRLRPRKRVTTPAQVRSKVLDVRPRPESPADWPKTQIAIPGPPVPKPAFGVWTDELKKWFPDG